MILQFSIFQATKMDALERSDELENQNIRKISNPDIEKGA